MENPVLYRVMQAYANDCGVIVSNDYSGRFMYGRKCVSVEGSESLLQCLFKAVLLDYHQSWIEAENQRMIGNDATAPDILYEELLDLLLVNYKTDSMGRGIVVYWPEWQHTEVTDEQ